MAKEHTKYDTEKVDLEPIAKSQEVNIMECEHKDTTISIGDFEYDLRKVNKREYELYWGNAKEKRKYKETFQCWRTNDDTCDFTPKVDTITKDGVLLKVTTATPSTGNCSPIEYKMIFLPKDKTQPPFELEYYLKFENNSHLSKTFLTISNISRNTDILSL